MTSVFFHFLMLHKFKNRPLNFVVNSDFTDRGIGKYTFKSKDIPSNYLSRIKKQLDNEYKDKEYKLKIYVYSIFPCDALIDGDTVDVNFVYEEEDGEVKLE